MMKNKLLGAICAVALGIAASAASAQQQFVMKLSSPTVNDIAHEWMKAFKAGVEQRSNNRIKVEIYPANQLGQIPATVEGVAMGTIEFAVPAVGFFVGLEPRFQVFDIMGLYDDMAHAARVFQDPEVRKMLATFGQSKGVEPLYVLPHGPLGVVSHKAIRSVADFKGQKLRMPGGAPVQVEPFRKLGVSPLSIPLGEVLPVMQNKTIDGAIISIAVFAGQKYYDVAKPMTMLPGSFLTVGGVVNRDFMKSIGPELEKIVREESQKAELAVVSWGVEDAARASETWKKNGGEVITLADTKLFQDEVASVLPTIFANNARLKQDYDILVEAAKRQRK